MGEIKKEDMKGKNKVGEESKENKYLMVHAKTDKGHALLLDGFVNNDIKILIIIIIFR